MSIWSRVIFFTVIFFIVFGLQFLVYRIFTKFLKSLNPIPVLLIKLTRYSFIFFNLPYLYIFFNSLTSNKAPEIIINYVYIPFYIFQSAVIFIGLFILILKILKIPFSVLILSIKKITGGKYYNKITSNKSYVKFDSSRRTFIKTSTALVSGYAFTGATLGVLDKDNYEINHVDIRIKNIPDNLKGTTITLISDIHSGPYMRENLMKEYAEIINDLDSDIILLPGDMTNSEKSEVIPFASAFKDLKAKHGIYATLGNHDFFSDPDYISSVVHNETPIKILRNDIEILNLKGENVCILGTDDTRQSGSNYDEILMRNLDKTLEKAKNRFLEMKLDSARVPKISLFHKPYFFEEISRMNLDLILSGHTHGGQVVLAKFGNLNLSLASAVSKYLSGLYTNDYSNMYVSKGIGCVALPIRFNCKPEITKITLI